MQMWDKEAHLKGKKHRSHVSKSKTKQSKRSKGGKRGKKNRNQMSSEFSLLSCDEYHKESSNNDDDPYYECQLLWSEIQSQYGTLPFGIEAFQYNSE